MKKFKQISAAMLAFLIILSQCTPAYAYYTYKYSGIGNMYEYEGSPSNSRFVYEIVDENEKTAIITYIKNKSYKGKDLVIPKEIDGYKIIGIGSFFDEKIVEGGKADTVKSIVIEADLVNRINFDTKENDWEIYDASDGYTGFFTNFKNLETVVLPDTLKAIDGDLFYNCKKLKSVNMPSGLEEIGYQAFYGCSSLKMPTFPSTLTTIYSYAFYGCSAFEGKITLPKNLKYLCDGVFANCSKLNGFDIAKGNNNFSVKSGVLFNADKTTLICYTAGKTMVRYTVPGTVTEIRAAAFDGAKNLKSVTIQSGISNILYNTFRGAGLENLKLPKDIRHIYDCAFANCKSLKTVEFNSNLKYIASNAFSNCKSLESVKLGKKVDVSASAFVYCTKLEKFEVSKKNKNLSTKSGVLYNKDKTKLIAYPCGRRSKSFTVPGSVKHICGSSFTGTKYLKEVKLPTSLKKLGGFAFCNSSVEKVNIPKNIPTINEYAFAHSKLKTITFDKRKKELDINRFAFLDCKNLTSITLPAQTDDVTMTAFYECDNLRKITVKGKKTYLSGRGDTDNKGLTSIDKLVIYGCENSKAQRYTEWQGIKFKAL